VRVDAFDYDLPDGAIAQEPCSPRDAARLLVAGPEGPVDHGRFRDLPGLLAPGDVVVVNDTRVLPARLDARRPTGGRVEVLLAEPAEGGWWWALLRATGKPRPGEVLQAEEGLRLVVGTREGARFLVLPKADEDDPWAIVERVGRMPLPPYIRRDAADPRSASDRERYQTVYARHAGAVAAPTAGLHFTPAVFDALAARGGEVAHLTLHVGIGTFLPVRVDRVEDHPMHAESYELPAGTAEAIERARTRGGRVVAIGTTVVRTLEHTGLDDGTVRPGTGRCDLFLVPGSPFRVVDRMVTNFHLPRSTLLMLVAAFVGRDRVLELYRVALDRGYRFYSYGDAMLLSRER
jgi:S-adenosylmethionine:tRNA ribosyltransferase-isomerase